MRRPHQRRPSAGRTTRHRTAEYHSLRTRGHSMELGLSFALRARVGHPYAVSPRSNSCAESSEIAAACEYCGVPLACPSHTPWYSTARPAPHKTHCAPAVGRWLFPVALMGGRARPVQAASSRRRRAPCTPQGAAPYSCGNAPHAAPCTRYSTLRTARTLSHRHRARHRRVKRPARQGPPCVRACVRAMPARHRHERSYS